MTTPCPQCGQPLSADAPRGLCPACLLKAALPGQSALESAATSAFNSTNAIAPESGTRLKYFGDYELLDEIARGGMGIVWKARQASLNRTVAIKMIRAGALAGPAEVERFLREAEAAANLQHPNIVAIHEVGDHDGQHYFSMDYVAGRDLAVLLCEGPMSAQRAARYVKIVAEAIHFAHQRGTLHRDLKPQNVLVDENDQPRVTDFGLAKIMTDDSRLTQSGVVMGSPSYMPPEQAAGRHADIGPASDVYSLGAMLYELLTGRPPFRGTTPLATMREVMEAEPTAPRTIRSDIPPDLETICLKCLEKSRTSRYPSARALAEELGRYLAGDPIEARPASTLRKTVSWVRRHPGSLSAIAALLMLGLAFGVFFLFEENAFLRTRQAEPTLERIRGWRYEYLKTLETTNGFIMIGSMWAMLLLMSKSLNRPLKEMFDPTKQAGTRQPLSERMRAVALGVGVVCVGSGLLLFMAFIQVHVWEGETAWRSVIGVYAAVYWGIMMLVLVVRDYRISQYGVPSRTLTDAEREPIRIALEDYDVPAAMRLYRQAIPEAGTFEASQFVAQYAQTLQTQHPGQYLPPPFSLARLNWRLMLVCVAFEAVLFAGLWAALPPTNPLAFVTRFANGYLFGVGLMIGVRVKGFWLRMLLIVPALAMMAVSVAVGDEPLSAASPWRYIIGLVFGIALMVTGFTRRRR